MSNQAGSFDLRNKPVRGRQNPKSHLTKFTSEPGKGLNRLTSSNDSSSPVMNIRIQMKGDLVKDTEAYIDKTIGTAVGTSGNTDRIDEKDEFKQKRNKTINRE